MEGEYNFLEVHKSVGDITLELRGEDPSLLKLSIFKEAWRGVRLKNRIGNYAMTMTMTMTREDDSLESPLEAPLPRCQRGTRGLRATT